jgi:membrane-bound lytic murein transglycosylase D
MDAAEDMSDSEQSAKRRQRWRLPRMALLLLIGLTLAGCLGRETKQESPTGVDTAGTASPTSAEADAGQTDVAMITPVSEDGAIWSRLRRGFRLGDISHPRIDREIRRLRQAPKAFVALMMRAEPYLHHILNEVEAAGLPTELALLPAVESGFRPHVYSPDGAAGLWQFMPATGRMMGLEQDWWFDTRRSVRPATDAAIAYLEKLNGRFSGDWLHTLAAYNAGARKVGNAIRKARRRGEPTDFWSLDLPGETDRYVPRLLALAMVVDDPEKYGLELPKIDDRPYFAPAFTAGQIDLNVAAELAGIPVEDLLVLNAGHKRWTSRPDGPHELLLPVDRVYRFEFAAASLPDDKRLRLVRHRIQPGESLSRIARRYGVTVQAIRQSNGLKDSRIRAGEELLVPLSDSVVAEASKSNELARQRLYYRVRKGDSLYTIARRFQVSIADLKRWNRVGRYIRPGERLTVFIDPDA